MVPMTRVIVNLPPRNSQTSKFVDSVDSGQLLIVSLPNALSALFPLLETVPKESRVLGCDGN